MLPEDEYIESGAAKAQTEIKGVKGPFLAYSLPAVGQVTRCMERKNGRIAESAKPIKTQASVTST
jgi:hypothetical protein